MNKDNSASEVQEKKENPILSIIFNIVIPVLILNKLSKIVANHFPDVNLSPVVGPGNAEDDDALRLGYPLKDLHVHKIGIFNDVGSQGFGDFPDGLMEFGFSGVACFYFSHEAVQKPLCKCIHIHKY